MKKRLLGGIVVLVLVVFYFSIGFNSTKQKNPETKSLALVSPPDPQRTERESHQMDVDSGTVLENILIGDRASKKLNLSDVFQGSPKVIYKFSEANCSNCIDHGLEFLMKYKDKIGQENIVLIGEFVDRRKFLIFPQIHDIQFKTYQKPMDVKLFEPLDALNLPYILILSPKLEVISWFIPDKSFPQKTDRYLKTIISF